MVFFADCIEDVTLLTIFFTDCIEDVTLLTIPSNAACNLHSTCTNVDCCMYVDFLQQGFHSFVRLDPCNHKLSFGLDRLTETVDLNGYAFGKIFKCKFHI